MEKEDVERFIGKKVKLEKKTTDPQRCSFKLYGTVQEVTNSSIVFMTDHIGVIALSEIISIEENVE